MHANIWREGSLSVAVRADIRVVKSCCGVRTELANGKS